MNKTQTSRSARSTSRKRLVTVTEGTPLSNYKAKNTFPLDHIYVNPTVTREGQRELATKLHSEIDSEKELSHAFIHRPQPPKAKDRVEDQAKIFNDFCVQFIDSSKDTKEKVTNVLLEAQNRLSDLEDIRSHLEEVERATYRFEMGLPEPTSESPDDIATQLIASKESMSTITKTKIVE